MEKKLKHSISIESLILKADSKQRTILESFLEVQDHIEIVEHPDRTILNVVNGVEKCPITVILHNSPDRLSIFLDSDVNYLNYENYEIDHSFFEWIIKGINLILCSRIKLEETYLNNKIVNKRYFISLFENKDGFDYPIIAINRPVWFWKKKKLKMMEKKYSEWIKN